MNMHNPPHPGLLVREWMNGRTVTEVADHLGVSRISLSHILNGRSGISAEMAIRLSQVFGTSADLWVGLQSQYDLWHARKKRIKTKPLAAA